MDYTRNSKNRKLKTQILGFFSRLNFGTHRLWLPGKSLIFCTGLLLVSLFFPWLSFEPMSGEIVQYWAFSIYLWWIGYGAIFAIILIAFFLFSHEKKEHLRWYVPFRLSDAQAIVFIGAILTTACTYSMIASFAYARIASQKVTPWIGLELAFWTLVLLLFVSYFFSQSEKTKSITMSYLDKKEISHLDEYAGILEWASHKPGEKVREKNMTLPI